MPPQLPWLEPHAPFPAPTLAWGEGDPAPGLLAAGGALDVASLCAAYAQGTFPWYGPGQPILWWAPDPRMVLPVAEFRLRRSLRKKLQAFRRQAAHCEIRIDSHFGPVINACANSPRAGQAGTWILPTMVQAYCELHAAGYAHSVETWIDGELAGGLYGVNVGRMFFGESMFSTQTDASKMAFYALMLLGRENRLPWVDCQLVNDHLLSLGACTLSRHAYLNSLQDVIKHPPIDWKKYQDSVFSSKTIAQYARLLE